MEDKSIVNRMKDAIVGSIRGAGEIVNAMVDTVSGTRVKHKVT